MPVKVALANDDRIIIEGLRSMLGRFPERVEVVGTAKGDPEILLTPEEHPEADVLLLDTFGRRADGIDAAGMVLSQDPPFRVVIFTDAADERLLLQALRLGVAGYLLKSADAVELVDDIERVHGGERVIDRRLATATAILAADAIEIGDWPGAHLGLTRREAEVLTVLAGGTAPDAIAAKLGISAETVRSHLRSVYLKLGVNDRVAAAAIAWREGLVS